MTLPLAGWFSIALAVTLVLAGLSIVLVRPVSGEKGACPATRFFLVALRLAIGWHFFIEGLDKLESRSWSSEGYLREATGPLAPVFHGMAGDRLRDQLTIGADASFPPELDAVWQAYLDAIERYYDLGAEERVRARAVVDQAKKNAVTWLTVRKKIVEIPSASPPTLKVAKTIPERLELERELENQVRDIEENKMPRYGSEFFAAWRASKANLARWRGALVRDLGLVTKDMKRGLQGYLLEVFEAKLAPEERKRIAAARETVTQEAQKERASPEDWEEEDRLKDKWTDKVLAAYRAVVDSQRLKDPKAGDAWDRQSATIVAHIIDKQAKDVDPYDPLPFRAGPPLSTWTVLDWSDAAVKYGLTIVGACLLAGFLTRTACIVGAGYLLLFFLAMPPLPGWPESPRAEGHYLFINKNLIEMLALLLLATTRSGRWAGLDGFFQFFRPASWRGDKRAATLEAAAK